MQDVCTDPEMVLLLESAKRHDTDALDRLYQLYIDKVYRYIWYRVGDQATAEDLAMDVFVRLVEHIGGFRIPRNSKWRRSQPGCFALPATWSTITTVGGCGPIVMWKASKTS